MDNMTTRNDKGRFLLKGDSNRLVRSIRATDSYWNRMGEIADENDITRADLLERMIDEIKSEQLPIIKEIDKGIEEKIKEIIDGLKRGGDNHLQIDVKERAIVRRALEALIEYLK